MRRTLAVLALTMALLLGGPAVAEKKPRITPEVGILRDPAAQLKVPVGKEIGTISFRDTSGNSHHLDELIAKGPVVFVFTSTECPMAQRYTQRLNRLRKEFAPRGVSLFAVYANADVTLTAVKKHGKEWKLELPLVHDKHGHLARRLGASMTPQALVLDTRGVLRYRGAIDDNRFETRVKHRYLRDALTTLLNKQPVKVTEVKAHGCTISRPEPAKVGKVTYATHIAAILQDHCVSCHRPGQVAPFSLTTYQKARRYAREIDAYTHARLMPPWRPQPGFGSFRGERYLGAEELQLIRRWVKDGTPKGDDKDLPPARPFKSEWALGKPDQVIEMPEEYTLGAEGEDDYRHFIIPTNFANDRYIRAIDVRPGNSKIVHHVIAYVDVTGKARKLDKADPGPGYTKFGGPGFKVASMLGGWAPGTMPQLNPKGTARWLPKGGDIVLQVHYYRSGKVEKDRTRVALYFSKDPKPARIHTTAAINKTFVLPPGARRHEVKAQRRLPIDVYAVSTFPHMHLLGREIKVTAKLPSGKVVPLIWIKNWDFNWQQGYVFKQPIFLPKGTVIQTVAYYDNSTNNPNNPNNPPKPVGWGEKTTDEMCIGFVSVVVAREYAPKRKKKTSAQIRRQRNSRKKAQ